MVSIYGRRIAEAALKIGAVELNPDKPVGWASGYHMPIYNNNRRFLKYFNYRELIASGFRDLIELNNILHDVIAGVATAGISPATTLADMLRLPLVYVRDKPKDHGLKKRIEGIDAESGLAGQRVILVEDLISTGGSSVNAIQAIRDAGGECNYCLSIFSYGLEEAAKCFSERIKPPVVAIPLLTYDDLVAVAKEHSYFSGADLNVLDEWRADPFGWGERHGFPRVQK